MNDQSKTNAKPLSKSLVKLDGNGLKAGSLIEQSFSSLNQKQSQKLMANAAKEALRLEAKSREQNMDYHLGRKEIEDHIEMFNMADKRGATTRLSIQSNIKTGAGTVRIESKSGATCFVASVAYDDPNHPDVMFLRYFRDMVLRRSNLGRAFIKWYWTWGPRVAKAVKYVPGLKKFSRAIISVIVAGLKKHMPSDL